MKDENLSKGHWQQQKKEVVQDKKIIIYIHVHSLCFKWFDGTNGQQVWEFWSDKANL